MSTNVKLNVKQGFINGGPFEDWFLMGPSHAKDSRKIKTFFFPKNIMTSDNTMPRLD